MKKIEKIHLFRSLFNGLQHVYGTYLPENSQVRVVKETVTDHVIWHHLQGVQSYGVFLLQGNRVGAIAVDFDDHNIESAILFQRRAEHYQLPVYIETSKGKGHHAWIFFQENVLAWKARCVVALILREIELPKTEIFPKQDQLDSQIPFGNFINAPLFGKLIPSAKTVFLNPFNHYRPYVDQWILLQSVQKVLETKLDEIIELNQLRPISTDESDSPKHATLTNNKYGLPICAKKMLQNGVSSNQRLSCFRLAVHFYRLGVPPDVSLAALQQWASKNKPNHNKRIITFREIQKQNTSAYENGYVGYGCECVSVKPFCDKSCPVYQNNKIKREGGEQYEKRN